MKGILYCGFASIVSVILLFLAAQSSQKHRTEEHDDGKRRYHEVHEDRGKALDSSRFPYKCISSAAAETQSGSEVDVINVAIAFFGVSRNLGLVLPTIERRVFSVLRRAGVQYDIFWYTALSGVPVEHLRGIEHRSVFNDVDIINPFEVSYLREVCRFSLVDQEEIRFSELQRFLMARNITRDDLSFDNWRDHYNSMENVLTAYYTQGQVYKMIQTHSLVSDVDYAGILAIRPDTAMFKDIDLPEQLIPHIRNVSLHGSICNDTVIWVPDFQHWSGYNDRAAYGSMNAMSLYLQRGVEYRDSVYRGGGEKFLPVYVAAHNMTVRMSSMRMLRVRANGALAHPDHKSSYMNIASDDRDYAECVDASTHSFKSSC